MAIVVSLGMSSGYSLWAAAEATPVCDEATTPWCVAPRLNAPLEQISGATIPKLATPAWMEPVEPAGPRVVSYNLSSRGTIAANLDEFASVVRATLSDARGWTRLGVSFQQVETGGDMTIYLSASSQIASFSSSCEPTAGCTVGKAVVINQDRWQTVDQSWIKAGADQASYRQMMINHEIGHWLGLGHRSCPAVNEPAPVMQPQLTNMQGCTPNAWPLGGELYSPALGIRS